MNALVLLLAMPKPTRVEHLSGDPSQGRLLALPANIRLDWKSLQGAKHPIFVIQTFVNYGRKKFYNIWPSLYTLLLAVVVAAGAL